MPIQKYWVKGLIHADEERIARHLKCLDGVLFAVLNHDAQCAEVEFEDDGITTREIRDAIVSFGYEVRIAS